MLKATARPAAFEYRVFRRSRIDGMLQYRALSPNVHFSYRASGPGGPLEGGSLS